MRMMSIKQTLMRLIAEHIAMPVIKAYGRKYCKTVRFFERECQLAKKEKPYRKSLSAILSAYELENDTYGQKVDIYYNMRHYNAFGLLSPLTFEDWEFNCVSGNIKQNNRRSSVFIEEDLSLRDIDAVEYRRDYTVDFDSGQVMKNIHPILTVGTLFIYNDCGDPTWDKWTAVSSSVIIKNKTDYYGAEYVIPMTEVVKEDNGQQDVYKLTALSRIPKEFRKKFSFVQCKYDALISTGLKDIIAEDFAFVKNAELEGWLSETILKDVESGDDDYENSDGYAAGRPVLGPCGFYYGDKEFKIVNIRNNESALKFVRDLMDAGYPDNLIHAHLILGSEKCGSIDVEYRTSREEDCHFIGDIANKCGFFWDDDDSEEEKEE